LRSNLRAEYFCRPSEGLMLIVLIAAFMTVLSTLTQFFAKRLHQALLKHDDPCAVIR
jgi:hypothetical protein